VVYEIIRVEGEGELARSFRLESVKP